MEATERDEFRTPVSPEGLRVVQVTTYEKQSSHVAAQNSVRWTPDSKRFVFEREAADDGSRSAGVWLCDVSQGFDIRPVFEFTRKPDGPLEGRSGKGETLAWQMIPNGSGLYVVRHQEDRLVLARIDLATGKAEERLDAPAPLATRWMDVSLDSERVAFGIFLGDGRTEGAPWAMRIFDVAHAATWILELGNQCRKGAYYRLSTHPEHVHDLLAYVGPERLCDGSWLTPPDGSWRWRDLPKDDGSRGWGFHFLVRDDGRDYPRGDAENCRIIPLPRPPLFRASHMAWRGQAGESLVASMYHTPPGLWRAPFIEAQPLRISAADRKAERLPETAKHVDLTRFVARADACHFNFDASGEHLVSDTDGYVLPQTCMLYVASYIQPRWGGEPYLKTRLLGIPRTSWKTQPAHPHPFLSPDGRYVVFQSDFTGRPQVHVAYGFEYP